MDPNGNIQSSNNKLLENISTLLNYVETSRKDLLDATKSIISAYKNEYEQTKTLEDDMEKLRALNANLELARDKLENDLLRLREAYNKEVMRNGELTETVKALQLKLKKIGDLMPLSRQSESADEKNVHFDNANPCITPRKETTLADQTSSTVVSPEFVSSAGTSSSTRRLKSSNLYSVPKQSNSEVIALKKRPSSAGNKHKFVEESKLRFQTCQNCKGSILPLVKYYQCSKCSFKIDRNCYDNSIFVDCEPQKIFALEELVGSDSEYAVPDIVRNCCEQIEQRGIDKDGLYEPKNDQEASKLLDKYLNIKNAAQLKLHKVDPAILSDLVLNVLTSMAEPLISAKAFQDFARASDQKGTDERIQLFRQLLAQLNKPHRHTLAFLLLHLKQISSKSFSNRLDKNSLATLFGPIIANTEAYKPRSESKDTQDQIKRTQLQKQIVLALLDFPAEYFNEALHDQRDIVPHMSGRRTTNYQVMLMNDQQRQSFYDNLSNSMY